MKKLDQFILKSFIGPFFGLLAIVVFIFMLQCLWLYIDELVGKGLGLLVVLEFLFWGSCTMLPICLPLATLLASVMVVGAMGENNELMAMKAAGLSLSRILRPLIYATAVICVGAYFVSNNLVPVSYNKIYTLRDDFRKTKQEINIPVGMFYDGIDGYMLRVESKDKKTGMMYGVTVYDHSGTKGNDNVTLADSAMMTMTKTKDYLVFQLFSGVNYQETNNMKARDTSLQVQQIKFSSQQMVIALENYSFQKSSENRYGNQIKSMDNQSLRVGKDSLLLQIDSIRASNLREMLTAKQIRYNKQLDTSNHYEATVPMDYGGFTQWRSIDEEMQAYEKAATNVTDLASHLKSVGASSKQYLSSLRKTDVELMTRIAQALLCLILFFIGAPLGAFIRKGGVGISAIIAVLFFVLYWVVNITGTKLGKDGAVAPVVGAFISTLVMAPIGAFLTYKAIKDASLFNTDNFGAWWRKTRSQAVGLLSKTRIVYMGTPEFAVAPLEALLGYKKVKVVAVVTVPDKPSGRGLKVNESAVKKYAVEHGLPVLQPEKLKDPAFLDQLASYKADIFVVVGFRMLPEDVWRMPSLGTFNLHAALLPQYRGAAPINWAVINGERMTGVTTFMIDKNIDTGGIILRQECRIGENDTAGDVHDALMPLGARLVLETVQGMMERSIETRVQRSFIMGSEVLHPAPKLTRELFHIDWSDTSRNIHNLIRGLSPYPAAYTELLKDGEVRQLKIFGSRILNEIPEGVVAGAAGGAAGMAGGLAEVAAASEVGISGVAGGSNEISTGLRPGTIVTDGKSLLAIATADGYIEITDLQLAGKKRMSAEAFLLGFRHPESYTTSPGTSKRAIAATR